MKTLPEIDLAPFMAAPQSAAGRAVVERLRAACHGPGFCYLVGHGVPAELAKEALRLGAAKLPIRTRFVQRIAD